MPVVTRLEVHHHDKERVMLYVDDEYTLDLPLLEAARLRRGQCLTTSELMELAGAADLQRALDRALRFLSYRPRSAAEVGRHLARKNYPDSLICMVIKRLKGRGYVDDAEFARFWVDSRKRSKPIGMWALRHELREKGVDDGIVDAVLADLDESALAYRAAEARLYRYKGHTRASFTNGIAGLLRRRGFSASTIRDVASRLMSELEERCPDYFQGSGKY